MMPSDNSCPSGFTLVTNTYTAATSNDLVANPRSGYVCYGKDTGKINKPQFASIDLSEKLRT